MKTELPRNEALLEALEAKGDVVSLDAYNELVILYSTRNDYFMQLIEQCDEIDELRKRLGDE